MTFGVERRTQQTQGHRQTFSGENMSFAHASATFTNTIPLTDTAVAQASQPPQRPAQRQPAPAHLPTASHLLHRVNHEQSPIPPYAFPCGRGKVSNAGTMDSDWTSAIASLPEMPISKRLFLARLLQSEAGKRPCRLVASRHLCD